MKNRIEDVRDKTRKELEGGTKMLRREKLKDSEILEKEKSERQKEKK